MNSIFSITYAFNNFSEFLMMGKHGFYIWLSYGIFISCILGLSITAYLKSKRLKNSLRKLKIQ